MQGTHMQEEVVKKLAEQWDRLVYADSPDYRTTQWEYFGIPYLICYHVETARFHVFVEGRMNRWDVTITLCDHALASAAVHVYGHRAACEEEW